MFLSNPQLAQENSLEALNCPQRRQRNPRRSATKEGTSEGKTVLGFIESTAFFSFVISAGVRTSTSGRSGLEGLCNTLTSSVGSGKLKAIAWASMLLPVPGAPTSSKFLRWLHARRATATASSWPIICSNASLGTGISEVEENFVMKTSNRFMEKLE